MENENCVIDKFKGCCCKCEYNIPLMKHPINLNIGKGNMSEIMGFACIGFFSVNERIAHFFDKEHGMCELYLHKQQDNGKI